MSTIVEKKLKIILEPESPIHVWGGDEIIIGVDSFIQGNNIYIPDLDKTLDRLDLRELDIVIKYLEEKKLDQLYDHIKHKLVIKKILKNYTGASLSGGSRIRLLPEEVIPGSSLKGYLRTAILYNVLKSMNTNVAINLINKNVQLTGDPRYRAIQLERILFERDRPPKAGGFYDVFSVLMISDPIGRNLNQDSLVVRKLEIIEKPSLSLIGSINAEFFEKGSLEYELSITKPPERQYVEIPEDLKEIFNEIYDLISRFRDFTSRDLLSLLRDFGCELIDAELEKIRGIQEFDRYRVFLEDLKRKYCGSSECAPARIGFGAGHESKTIAIFLRKYYPVFYDNLKSYMKQNIGRIWDSLTIKAVKIDGEYRGVGWCRLCVK